MSVQKPQIGQLIGFALLLVGIVTFGISSDLNAQPKVKDPCPGNEVVKGSIYDRYYCSFHTWCAPAWPTCSGFCYSGDQFGTCSCSDCSDFTIAASEPLLSGQIGSCSSTIHGFLGPTCKQCTVSWVCGKSQCYSTPPGMYCACPPEKDIVCKCTWYTSQNDPPYCWD